MTATESPTATWWQSLYDGPIGEIFLERPNASRLEREIDCLTEQLDVLPGATLFDQCCGTGSQGLALARRGFAVFGVDQAEGYIQQAAASARDEVLPAVFVAADARDYVPPKIADGGYNWGTSFGNGLNEDDHLRMLTAARQALKAGARYAVEFPNMVCLLRDFQTVLTRRKTLDDGTWLVVRESTLDLHAGALLQRWTIFAPDGTRREVDTQVRLYLPHELRLQMERAGFVDVRLLAAPSGQPLDTADARCLAVGRVP